MVFSGKVGRGAEHRWIWCDICDRGQYEPWITILHDMKMS